MPKILQSTAMARRLAIIPLLAVAMILPSRAATPTLTTLYSFTDLGDGGFPEAGLVLGGSGAVFGTTSTGMSGWGSVFELVPSTGGATWTESTIYEFTGGADGGNPVAGLVIGKSNVMYGTTYSGGAHGYGTVFELIPPSAGGAWTEKVLYSFAGGTADGGNPAAGLAINSSGVLYGTTYNGGSSGFGIVFELIPSAGGWSEKVIYTFLGGVDGANPLAGLTLASSGALFGTTSQGGQYTVTNQPPTCTPTTPCTVNAWGTAFELTPKGGGVFTETVIYTFTGGADGGSPESSLTLGKSGALFGNAFWGGLNTACVLGDFQQGCGTVFELIPPTGGGAWTEKVLYTFTGHSPDGAHPYGSLGINSSGVVFGTTFSGGANVTDCFPESYTGCGTAFYITPPSAPGGKWVKNNLIAFPGSPGGGVPNGIAMSKGGNMYGTTIEGGTSGGYGTVFLMTP